MADDFDALLEPTEADYQRLGLSKLPWHKSAADFPYDASLRGADVEGLDRLRRMPDRELAQLAYEQFMRLDASYWGTEDAERDRERLKRRAEDREVARIVPFANRAFKGEMSLDAKLLAERILFPAGYVALNRTMLPALREFAQALYELKRSGRG